MKRLYAILDRIANELVALRMYQVMSFRTDPEATRYFADAINDETSILHKHPDDYALLYLGEITDTGAINSTQPQIIVTGGQIAALAEPRNLIKEVK